MVFADPISALPHIDAGTLLALAVTSKERSPVAPEVPTVSESGYPGFDADRLARHPGARQHAARHRQQTQCGDRARR